jgi:hypothetical protein
MKYDISIESDLNNLLNKSYLDEYKIEEHMSLEDAANEICGILSEEQQLAQEGIMETFRKVKAFIIAIFRKIINVIKMWWKKRAIKKLGKVLRSKLAPLSMGGQILWLMSVIVRNQIKYGISNASVEIYNDGEIAIEAPQINPGAFLGSLGAGGSATSFQNMNFGSHNGYVGATGYNNPPTAKVLQSAPPTPTGGTAGGGTAGGGTAGGAVSNIRNITNDALLLILAVCSSGDFLVKISGLKRRIKDLSISDMERTVAGFRKLLPPEAMRFIRHGGIFGHENFTDSPGLRSLCGVAAGQLGLDTKLADISDFTRDTANNTYQAIVLDGDTMMFRIAQYLGHVIDAMRSAGMFKNGGVTITSTVSLMNLFAVYNKSSAAVKNKFDRMLTGLVGDIKPFTKGDATMVERSLSELVDFYNLFTLKAMHFMDTLESEEKEGMRPIIRISKEILHQIFGLINHCNYLVSDIDMTKYDIDLNSDEQLVDEILSGNYEDAMESDASDDDFDFEL